jgi:hypothetical protein
MADPLWEFAGSVESFSHLGSSTREKLLRLWSMEEIDLFCSQPAICYDLETEPVLFSPLLMPNRCT